MPAQFRLKRLADLQEALDSEKIVARPSDGTLLGLIRNADIIPHDNDFDYDVVYDEKHIRSISKIAHKKKWKLGRKVCYKGKPQQLCFYDDDEFIYDFIIWHPGIRFYVNFSEPKHFRIMEKKYLDDLINIKIGDKTTFRVPRRSKEYLEYRYGPDWEVPQSQKGRWQDDCGDMELMTW